MTSACVVSDRVYINSIADGSKKSGKLGVGYGGGGKKLGPEFGFGLSMAQKIEGPEGRSESLESLERNLFDEQFYNFFQKKQINDKKC